MKNILHFRGRVTDEHTPLVLINLDDVSIIWVNKLQEYFMLIVVLKTGVQKKYPLTDEEAASLMESLELLIK